MHKPITVLESLSGFKQRMQRAMVPKVLWRLASVALIATIVVVLSISHIMRAGAKAVFLYVSTRNANYIEREHHTERRFVNIRPEPGAEWINNNTQVARVAKGSNSPDLERTIGVTFANVDRTSIWSLGKLGIAPWFTRTVGRGVYCTMSITLPPRTRTRVMIGDMMLHHWGLVDTFDHGKYTGTQKFDYDVPDNPAGGVCMSSPAPIPATVDRVNRN